MNDPYLWFTLFLLSFAFSLAFFHKKLWEPGLVAALLACICLAICIWPPQQTNNNPVGNEAVQRLLRGEEISMRDLPDPTDLWKEANNLGLPPSTLKKLGDPSSFMVRFNTNDVATTK